MNRSGLHWIIHKWVVCSVWHYPWACAASRGKCISLPWKTSVEQMLSVLSLSTKLWYKASNWLQQGLLPHWLISSCVELCHILAALQRILWVFSSWVCSNLLIVAMLSGVCHPNFFLYLVKSSCHPWLGKVTWTLSPMCSSSSIRMQLFLMTGLQLPHSAMMPCKAIFGVFHQHRVFPSHPCTCSQIQCNEGKGSCKTALFWAIYFKIYLKLEQVLTPGENTMRFLKVWQSHFFSF